VGHPRLPEMPDLNPVYPSALLQDNYSVGFVSFKIRPVQVTGQVFELDPLQFFAKQMLY
jgi:hypothetical protein